ncbi:hypothetical protein O181_014536 [Austropuccinia psidii MF-1]|uniref:Tf2-1-like SH3-like domain-containing protein n=1 Tax=Austropuccinia psidii MF-1 TaxID=1389203 RepID=A0A9Q3GP83_9BASI|nr:hypothetical protein [Austropuccinia psidii MF-1]
MAELCFDNTKASSTGFSPFFLWQGFHLRVIALTAPYGVPAVNDWLDLLLDCQHHAKLVLSRSHEQQSLHYDRTHQPAPAFRPGDSVLLRRRFIPTARPSDKLDHRFIGPFLIDNMVGINAVRLWLPAHLSRLHPVFNVNLLRPCNIPSVNPHYDLPRFGPVLVNLFPALADWAE